MSYHIKKVKHTRWVCYAHTPTNPLSKVVEGYNYTIVKKRYQIYWVSLTHWASSQNRTDISNLEGWHNSRYTILACCVPSWIRTMDPLVNSQVLYRWAKKTFCREDRIWTCDLLVPNQARYRATLLPYFISHMSKNTTNIQKKTFKNKKPRTFCVQGF